MADYSTFVVIDYKKRKKYSYYIVSKKSKEIVSSRL